MLAQRNKSSRVRNFSSSLRMRSRPRINFLIRYVDLFLQILLFRNNNVSRKNILNCKEINVIIVRFDRR